MARNDTLPVPEPKGDKDVLCICFNITRGNVRDFMGQPGNSVDDLVKATNYGTKCTACLLDLDVTVSELNAKGITRLPPGIGTGKITEAVGGMGAVERVDSAFFVCEGGIRTVLRLANFNPLFKEGSQSVAHAYRIWIMTEDGRIAARKNGRVEAQEQVEIDLSQIKGCPGRGWFLMSLLPLGPGYYGTLRPQGILIGPDWASAFHAQFHADASKADRRLAVGIRSTNGKTWSSPCIINGENRGGGVTLHLSGGPSYTEQYDFHLPGRGSKIIDLDDVFQNIPKDSSLILSVESETRTRKYLIGKQPDGCWGADHFPTFP